MDFGEQHRLELAVSKSLEHATSRIKKLEGRDKLALQSEFLEWIASDQDDIEVKYVNSFDCW